MEENDREEEFSNDEENIEEETNDDYEVIMLFTCFIT